MPDSTVWPVRRTGAAATGEAERNPAGSWAADPPPEAGQGSVFVTGQVCSREQRRGRYTPESLAHPGKMLPSIGRYLINTYTEIGEWVCDPMAGIFTTVVEAMHLGRHGIGVEYEARWAALAAGNIRLATAQGAAGTGQVVHGDSRHLATLIPPELHGRIALVITSPPYGPSTHGHVRTPGPRRGKVAKINHRYGGDAGNLAYRHHDELADIPGMVVAAGINAGLRLHEECAALIAGIRDGRLVPRASFFQQRNVRAAIADGDPQWLLQHEDVLLFRHSGGAS